MSELIKIFNKSVINSKIYVENFNIIYNLISSLTKEELEYQDNKGKSILHYLCSKKIYDVFQIELLYLLLEKKVDIDQQDYEGRTALHYAAYYSYFDIIKILILRGNANINVQDLNGKSVLHLNYGNFSNKKRKDKNEITKFLIKHGCDVNLRDILGETVLFYEMIELYIIQEDKINSEIIETKKLLDYAKYYDTEDEIIDLLLEHKCDVNIQNMDGESALTCTMLYSYDTDYWKKYLYKMLKAGYDLKQTTYDNHNILNHILKRPNIYFNDFLLIKLLIKENIDYKLINLENNNILHDLCSRVFYSETNQKEFKKLVYFLIDNGIDINKQNDDGETPLHCFFNNKTINYLNQHMFRLKEKERRKFIIEFIIKLLKKYNKIDILITNQEGQTFFEKARKLKYEDYKKLMNYCINKFNNLLVTEIDKFIIIDLENIYNILNFMY